MTDEDWRVSRIAAESGGKRDASIGDVMVLLEDFGAGGGLRRAFSCAFSSFKL